MYDGSDIDPATGIETLAFSGQVDLNDVVRAFKDIAARLAPGTRRLWDFRGVTLDMPTDVLASLGAEARGMDQPGARVALLVDSDLNFGLCREHLAYRESEQVRVNVFRDADAARAWLRGT